MEPTTPAPTAPMEWTTSTIVILSLIALLAVVTILAIIRGARLRRERQHARLIEEERIEAEMPPAPIPPALVRRAPEPMVRAAPASDLPTAPQPLPFAPSPPPLDDSPVAGTTAPARSLVDEPIAAAAPLDASPATEAAAPAPAEPAPADRPVTILKGLGPRVATRLEEQGIVTVGDLARLSDDEAEALDTRLGPFTGRMSRDRWLEQARFLAAGDDKGFEAVFGRL